MIRAAEAIYRLVRVADHAKIGAARSQEAQQPMLRRVHILVFVHRDPAKACLDRSQNGRIGLQQLDGAQDQIIKIERVGLRQSGVIALPEVNLALRDGPGRGGRS